MLPLVSLPDGVSFHHQNHPPPPPRFFTTTLSRGAAAVPLTCACVQFFEALPCDRSQGLRPLLEKILREPADHTPPPLDESAAAHLETSAAGSAAGSAADTGDAADVKGLAASESATSLGESGGAAEDWTPRSGRRRKDLAMRRLRAHGYPLGVCALALQVPFSLTHFPHMPHPISPVYHRMQFAQRGVISLTHPIFPICHTPFPLYITGCNFLREVLFLSLTPFPPCPTPHSPYIITGILSPAFVSVRSRRRTTTSTRRSSG